MNKMNLSKKVLTSLLLASVATTAVQCKKSERLQNTKTDKVTVTEDGTPINNGHDNCPACGMG